MSKKVERLDNNLQSFILSALDHHIDAFHDFIDRNDNVSLSLDYWRHY